MEQAVKELRVGPRDFEVLARQLAESGTQIRFRAYGSSMYPAIANGEFVTVAPLEGADEVKVGDIVLGSVRGRLVAHRIVQIRNSGEKRAMLMKGDSTSHVEEIRWEEVVGRVVMVERECMFPRRVRGKGWLRSRLLAKVLRTFLRSETE